ncbi:PIR protein [Plasmodium ovale]|uniref:PIR protein n=1 Tax=Plasmodium ovale TaxID=36330 RepID=A0A1D3JBZ7_PLAOA|nr:PIR protein [Plasmodium ovale]
MSSQTRESIYSFVSSFHTYKDLFDKANEVVDNSGIYKCDASGNSEDCNNPSFVQVCTKTAQYITLLKETYPNNTFGGCKYLNYWIQNEALSNIENKNDTLIFYQKVMNIYGYLIDSDTCDGNIENIDENIFGNVKTLYEVYDNFNKFRNTEEKEIGEKCAYATKSVTLYKECIRKCHENSEHNFCNEVEKFKWIYYEHMKSGTTCSGIPNELPSTRTYNLTVVVLVPGLIALVLPFLLFIFYKFTPLGFSLRQKIRRKKGMWNNLEHESHQFLQSSKRINKNSDNGQYNISYNSTKYSQ